jgi:flavin reductase (DIM6/NTAB) family NADH-FMN oxidoreductase RutF
MSRPSPTSAGDLREDAMTVAPKSLAPAADAEMFRHVLGHFCSGVTIITAAGPTTAGAPAGFTCQSFASLSLDPPLVVFSVGLRSRSWPPMRGTGAFAVNILTAAQEPLCRAFAVSGADKFAGVDWIPGPVTGSPLLRGSLAWLDCEVEAEHPGGDHTIVIGRVRALEVADATGEPLLFYRAAFRTPTTP